MSLTAAFERVDALARQKMATGRFPGLAVAITDRQELLWTGCYGYADVATGSPVTPETLFEIGSIGKSFTSLALLQLQEAGQLDVMDPVTRYLPWFQVQTRFSPICLHHLLSHTAGIVRGTDFSPDPSPRSGRCAIWKPAPPRGSISCTRIPGSKPSGWSWKP